MNEFSYEIISDGPHRPDRVYLVASGALFATGQVSFGEGSRLLLGGGTPPPPEEELPPFQFFEDRTPRRGA